MRKSTIGLRLRRDTAKSFTRATGDNRPSQPEFHFAYVARAVSAGHFAMPAADVADMYAPEIEARTTTSTMAVAAAN